VRLTKEQAMVELLRRVELALGEVFIVERREQGVVTHRAVRNRDALTRARKAYVAACVAIGKVRLEDGTASGHSTHRERASVRTALDKLDQLRRKLEGLEAIPR
jgi:hypothetical protein